MSYEHNNMEIEEYAFDEDTVCDICQAEFLDVDDLQMHISQYHLTNTKLSNYCPFCMQGFPDLDNFGLHMRNEHFSSISCCKYCTRFFIDPGEVLLNHEAKHRYPELKPKIACSHCENIFDSIHQLETHEFIEHRFRDDSVMLQDAYPLLSSILNMNIKLFIQSVCHNLLFDCRRCGLTTFDRSDFIQHLISENKRSFSCDICCNVYKTKDVLSNHCKTHMSGHSRKVYDRNKCKKCKKTLTATDLKIHSKSCVDMKCSTCSMSFDSVTKFAEHAACHSAEKTVPLQICKYCQRPLVGVDALEKHVARQHRHELHLYKYHCKNCEKIFKHPKVLFRHFFSKHKDIKPFTCKICNISFRKRRNFTIHIKLDHKSVGSVEFDDQFYVYFSDKPVKSKENVEHPRTSKDAIETDKDGAMEVVKDDENSENRRMEADIEVTVEEVSEEQETENLTSKTDPKSVDLDEIATIDNNEDADGEQKGSESIDIVTLDELDDSQDIKIKTSRASKREPRKRRRDVSSDDSDVPLVNVMKRETIRQKRKRRNISNKFTCIKCDRNCYTYQNYHRHMALHKKNERKICIKCHKTFRNEHLLKKHIKKQHSSSKLTETLKKVLERKNNDEKRVERRQSDDEEREIIGREIEHEKVEWIATKTFRSTIKKVDIEKSCTPAKITPVQKDKLSAKKFIENFMSENQDSRITISSSLSIKRVTCENPPPFIKLTKFTPEPVVMRRPKLRMPVKYKHDPTEANDVSIKVVNTPYEPSFNIKTGSIFTSGLEGSSQVASGNAIPDVGQEVMLGLEKAQVQRTIVIKDILDVNNIKIGHLWPEAPYFKIVKINEVVKDANAEVEEPEKEPNLTLPNGTKLVNVNPLSHLLGDRHLKDMRTRSRQCYYQPKVKNIGKALAKALMKLDKTPYAGKKEEMKKTKN